MWVLHTCADRECGMGVANGAFCKEYPLIGPE